MNISVPVVQIDVEGRQGLPIESGGRKETRPVNNISRQNAWPLVEAVAAHVLDHGRRDVEDEVGHDCAAAGAGG